MSSPLRSMGSPLGTFLSPAGFAGPSGVRALARELSTIPEGVRLVRRSRSDRRTRSRAPYAGANRLPAHAPVLLIPGFMAGDGTLGAMSSFLRRQGLRTYRADIHVNAGCTRDAGDRLERRLETIATKRGRKVTIVGHSLGGMLARGLAARRPDLVEGIVAMGSPVLAPGAVHRLLAWDAALLAGLSKAGVRGLMSIDCVGGECARLSFEESQEPLDPEIGFTAIYSRRDGIVDWRACLDPAATAVEVRTSHCGMAIDPVVMDHVLAAIREQELSRAARLASATAGHDVAEGSLRVVRT